MGALSPETQVIITIISFVITVYGFYTNVNSKSINQANEITTLKIEKEHLDRQIRNHERRLDKHDEQNKTLLILAEQIKALSSSVDKLDVEIKKLTRGKQDDK